MKLLLKIKKIISKYTIEKYIINEIFDTTIKNDKNIKTTTMYIECDKTIQMPTNDCG